MTDVAEVAAQDSEQSLRESRIMVALCSLCAPVPFWGCGCGRAVANTRGCVSDLQRLTHHVTYLFSPQLIERSAVKTTDSAYVSYRMIRFWYTPYPFLVLGFRL